jgi:hypothetical protein
MSLWVSPAVTTGLGGVAIQNVKYIQFFLSIKITMILSIKVDLVFFKKDVIQKIFEIFLFPNIGMLNE